MKPMLDLLIELQRAEGTKQLASRGYLSPREGEAARIHLRLLRDTIPEPVLTCYEALKVTALDLASCPAILAMAALVATYRALSPRKRRKLTSFFDLAGCRTSPRRGQPRRTRDRAANGFARVRGAMVRAVA